jgi:hypothetical protein
MSEIDKMAEIEEMYEEGRYVYESDGNEHYI